MCIGLRKKKKKAWWGWWRWRRRGSGWATYRVNQQETWRERDREEGGDNRNTRSGGKEKGGRRSRAGRRVGETGKGAGGSYLSGESALPSKLKRYSVRIVQWRTEQDTVKTSQPSRGVERWGIKLFSQRKRFTLNKRPPHLPSATCNHHLHLVRHHRSPFLFPPFSLNPPPLPPLLPPPLWWNLKQGDPQNIPAKSQKPAHTHMHRGGQWDWEAEKKQVHVWVVAGRSVLIREDEEKWPSAEGHPGWGRWWQRISFQAFLFRCLFKESFIFSLFSIVLLLNLKLFICVAVLYLWWVTADITSWSNVIQQAARIFRSSRIRSGRWSQWR